MFSPRPAGNPLEHVLSTEDKHKRPGLLGQVPGDAAAFFFFFFLHSQADARFGCEQDGLARAANRCPGSKQVPACVPIMPDCLFLSALLSSLPALLSPPLNSRLSFFFFGFCLRH